MKQVTQRLRNGQIEVVEVPRPLLSEDGVIVDVRASLLSAGTERSTVEAARKNLVGKARARPEQARQALEKARTDGVKATIEAVRMRLDQPSALGYSSAGVVLEVGSRVRDLRPGNRVACAGGGHAVHAELNYIPGNLCVRLPDDVQFEAGAFGAVGSVALHGVRQAEPQIGERVAVIGLGLVGQLACRLLLAAGCDVIGVDLDSALVQRAQESSVRAYGRGNLDISNLPAAVSNCDSILLTAATASDDPIQLAGALARDRARVVVVGDVRMSIPRSSYYGKELELRISRSYGPGRYDHEYEERGLDYPIGYVRWTERRNMDAFVSLLAGGRVSVNDLITARVPIEDAPAAYEQLLSGTGSPLGLVLTCAPSSPEAADSTPVPHRVHSAPGSSPSVGVIGAGSFSQRILIPGLRDAGFSLKSVASANGLSAKGAVDRFGFSRATTADELLLDDDLDVVCIASRHDTHASYAIRALEQGRAVFVEKPPALSTEQLDRVRKAAGDTGIIQVGFNRRFARLALAMREHVVGEGHPVELLYRVAAGRLPSEHWLNDPNVGGGRLLGEGCHFVDFACWFVGEMPVRVVASVPDGPEVALAAQRFSISLAFPGGSLATILYGSESTPALGKEYIEAHSGGKSAILSDFRRLELLDRGRARTVSDRRQDKGHRAQMVAFRRALEGEPGSGPHPLDTMAVTLRAAAAAREAW